MSLRATFSNSVTFTVTSEYGKAGGVEIESVFRPVYHVAVDGPSETGVFRHLFKHIFPGP